MRAEPRRPATPAVDRANLAGVVFTRRPPTAYRPGSRRPEGRPFLCLLAGCGNGGHVCRSPGCFGLLDIDHGLLYHMHLRLNPGAKRMVLVVRVEVEAAHAVRVPPSPTDFVERPGERQVVRPHVAESLLRFGRSNGGPLY